MVILLHVRGLAVAAAMLLFSFSFTPGVEAGQCSAGTVSMNVTTSAELQRMINTINCTGQAAFDVSWMGSLQLGQIIELSDKKNLTVTGSRPVLGEYSSAVIDAEGTTGIFRVSNRSTLNLNHLVVRGGASETGAAIDARFFSSVYAIGCAFTNNTSTTGGAIFASQSELHIGGDTVFADNSAQHDGGAIYVEQSAMKMDGNTCFMDNSAGNDGGALSVSNSSAFISGGAGFVHNTAREAGGAMSADGSDIYINGNSTFANNSVDSAGGAVFAEDSEIHIDGDNTFTRNSAGYIGGAIVSVSSNISIDGSTSFTSNSAIENGGAVSARMSEITLSGEICFGYNSAGTTGGGMYTSNSKIRVEGNSLFANNSALDRGGTMMTHQSEVCINGNTSFSHNSAGGDGGAVAWITSDINITGDVSFGHNSAKDSGGAIFSGKSKIRMAGLLWFGYNSATVNGGVLHAHTAPFYIEGSTTFTHNTAGQSGGALSYYAEVEVDIVGTTSFSYNSAGWRGGAIFIQIANISVNGTTSFVHNTAYEGGAIDAHQSPMHLEGSSTFVNNSAEQDGGAINVLGSNMTIVGEVEISSNAALNGGGIFSSLSPAFHVLGNVSFLRNYAKFYGGAISLTDPSNVYINGTLFEWNSGTSGGAVSLISTAGTTGGFDRCRFDGNDASNGGALYLSTNYTGVHKRPGFVHESVFLHNTAVELGGALFNSGEWEVNNTVFAENTAGGGGLAIHDEGPFLVLWNDTFRGNMFTCPSDQYSDAHHDTRGTCRLEVVCQQCSEGCQGDERIAMVESDTIPACEDIPDGVSQASTTTLQTFDLMEGYYRVSAESRIIRECFQAKACSGGTNHLDYCATGYTGPYCAVCADGYAPGVMNLCHECSTENRCWTVGFVTAALVLGIFVTALVVFHVLKEEEDGIGAACPRPMLSCHKWLAKALPLSAIKIVVVVLQIITQFTEIAGAVYPEEYEAFLSKVASINLDIGFILSNSCLVTTNFYDKLLLATIGPLVVLSALVGTLFIARRRSTNTETHGPLLQNKRASTGLFIVFFVYSSVSFTIFQTFVCDDLDDGMSYLRADYSLVCSSAKHAAYRTYASVMVCVYPVGIPTLFVWWLVRNRRDLVNPVREEMAHLESFRGLWAAYNPSCYYYEVVECSRRIALTGVAVFVLPNSADQVAVIFLLAVVFTFISESLSPFETKADMWLYRWGNAIILASMYVAFLLKVELADKESEASSLMTALLIAANVFMIVLVVVQGILLMKGLHKSRRMEAVYPASSASVSTSQIATSVG